MIIYLILAFLISWTILLSFVIFKLRNQYRQLISIGGPVALDEILGKLLSKCNTFEKQDAINTKAIEEMKSVMKKGVHRIGLSRFHAFGTPDGEQSFVLALLNDYNEGVVVTCMHIHSGVRIYVKELNGKEQIKLSDEEKKAIESAA